MKKNLLSIIFLSIVQFAFAQVPQSFTYQAIARDANGNPLVNQSISLKISIKTAVGGTILYQETHSSVTTNQFGLFTLGIGNGTPVTGTFAAIDWSTGTNYVDIEFDPNGGTNYLDMGTTQLLSVPYALYAGSSGGGGGTTGQDVLESDGTGSLTCNSNITSFAVIPGLTNTFNVPAGCKVIAHTIGGFSNSGNANDWALADIAIFVDGANTGTPSYQRIICQNTSTLGSVPGYWSMDKSLTLSAGPHTIDVRGLFNTSSESNALTINVGAAVGYVGNGELLITIIKQ